MHDYCQHYDLLENIVFNSTVKLARRNDGDTAWLLDVETDGTLGTVEFDRLAFCNGYQTRANIPTFEGQDAFKGTVMHAQAFREYVLIPRMHLH